MSHIHAHTHNRETARYNLQIPVIGVTVEVCVSAGRIVVYGSTSDSNPNSAFYEFFLQVVYDNDTEQCDHMFYKPDTLSPTSSYPSDVTDCIDEDPVNCNITGQFNCISECCFIVVLSLVWVSVIVRE